MCILGHRVCPNTYNLAAHIFTMYKEKYAHFIINKYLFSNDYTIIFSYTMLLEPYYDERIDKINGVPV